MADNLYDTGAPKRVIVEHRIIHEHRHEVVHRPEHGPTDRHKRVTITPEFQPVTEPKQLPPGKK
jgi:hypothetical protein